MWHPAPVADAPMHFPATGVTPNARPADNPSHVSVFLDVPESSWVASNELAFAI